jgi:hypothetical protein
MFGIIVLWFIGRGFVSACNQDEAKRMCRLNRPRMRFLISPKTAVCWFLLSANTDRRNFMQYEDGGIYSGVSRGKRSYYLSRQDYTEYMGKNNRLRIWQEFILNTKERIIVKRENLFESAMDSMENASLNIPLQNISSEYYYSNIGVKEYEDELRAALPPHLHLILSRLADKNNEREAASIAVSYRQGFSDSIRFIMQALSWEPSRR